MTSKEALEELLGRAMSKSYVGMVAAALEKDLDKLDQYETIEKELGIDLITLFKALGKGVFFIEEGKIRFNSSPNILFVKTCDIGSKPYFIIQCFGNKRHDFTINDYSKTWVLDKKELENGKD